MPSNSSETHESFAYDLMIPIVMRQIAYVYAVYKVVLNCDAEIVPLGVLLLSFKIQSRLPNIHHI